MSSSGTTTRRSTTGIPARCSTTPATRSRASTLLAARARRAFFEYTPTRHRPATRSGSTGRSATARCSRSSCSTSGATAARTRPTASPSPATDRLPRRRAAALAQAAPGADPGDLEGHRQRHADRPGGRATARGTFEAVGQRRRARRWAASWRSPTCCGSSRARGQERRLADGRRALRRGPPLRPRRGPGSPTSTPSGSSSPARSTPARSAPASSTHLRPAGEVHAASRRDASPTARRRRVTSSSASPGSTPRPQAHGRLAARRRGQVALLGRAAPRALNCAWEDRWAAEPDGPSSPGPQRDGMRIGR